jgi:hypothetical protein
MILTAPEPVKPMAAQENPCNSASRNHAAAP